METREERYATNTTLHELPRIQYTRIYYFIQVTDRLLPDVGGLLSPTGLLYVIVLPHNKPGRLPNVTAHRDVPCMIMIIVDLLVTNFFFTDEICSILESQGFRHEVVLQRRAQNENLFVYRFYRSNNTDLT